MKAPVGLLSDRAVSHSEMEGYHPDKLDYNPATQSAAPAKAVKG